MTLLPLPRRHRLLPGRFALPAPGAVPPLRVAPADASRPAVRNHARAAGLARLVPDPALPPHAAALSLPGAVPPGLPSPPSRPAGYALRLGPDGLAVRGADAPGLVWGLVTLGQLLAGAGREATPAVAIEDWPDYRVRYHHDDVSRKQVSTREDFARIFRQLARFKFSHATLYLEDMVRVDGVPLLGEGRGAFTPDELRDLATEAADWGVELFPTLSLAGHQENLLRLPGYRHLGAPTWQPPSSLDPAHPGVRDHLRRILDAVCPCFPSAWFHMAFDEVIGLDAERFAGHANWCAGELVARGKVPLFWADMLYNHFGCELLDRLHPALVPVPWSYGPAPSEAQQAFPALAARRPAPGPWVLAGYNNCARFLHQPLAGLQRHWAEWRAAAPPETCGGIGASQWGDEGYENHRDLGWPLFAAFAEQAWSGDDGEPATVEARFHALFHGHPLPALAQARRLLEELDGDPALRPWARHRLPAPGWVREAAAGDLPPVVRLRAAARRLDRAAALLATSRGQARAERAHLAHLGVALDRIRSVVARARAARGERPAREAVAALRRARRSYRAAWLAHNRPESIEVSLAVFDDQIAGWSALGHPVPAPRPPWHPLDLGEAWSTYAPPVAGLPIGPAVLAGVPYRFAPRTRTHAEIATGATLTVRLPGLPLRDLRLVATQPRRGTDPAPAVRLRLLHRGHVVFAEDLLAIRHLCDWWAPLGEHMWAGGGLAYVDPLRVSYLLSPGALHGLTVIHRFPWPAAPVADLLDLTNLAPAPLQRFALTLEEALR